MGVCVCVCVCVGGLGTSTLFLAKDMRNSLPFTLLSWSGNYSPKASPLQDPLFSKHYWIALSGQPLISLCRPHISTKEHRKKLNH